MTIGISLFTAAMYVATHYSYCSINGSKCWVAPTGIALKPRMGSFSNFTCINASCAVTWNLQGSSDKLENPNGTCVETVDISATFDIPTTKPFLLNPSTKTECRAVPFSWKASGWINFALVGFACLTMLLAGLIVLQNMFIVEFGVEIRLSKHAYFNKKKDVF